MLIKFKEYELYLRENEIAERTIGNYLRALRQLEAFMINIGIDDIELLEKEHLIEFKAHLKTVEWKPGRNYVLSSINQVILRVNIYFNWVQGTKNHDLGLKFYKQQTHAHRESINQNDFERLVRHSQGETKLFILTIANTGLRISEVCGLTVSDLDKPIIEINNKGKERVLDIPPFLKKELKKWCNLVEKQPDDCIFSKSQTHYRNQLKVIAGKSKVKLSKAYPHSIRHYFAKKFIADGGDSTDLQQMLGHSDIATTTIYTKKNKEELASSFRKIKNR